MLTWVMVRRARDDELLDGKGTSFTTTRDMTMIPILRHYTRLKVRSGIDLFYSDTGEALLICI